MKGKRAVLGIALAAALLCMAAPQAFEAVPDQARVALKGSRGKPIRTGLVFVNGHYLKPPYVVARYGTAIFINNIQVTDQVVSWRTFLGVQPGMAAAKPAAAKKPPAPAPAKKTATIDDLFDDDSAPAPAAGGSSGTAAAAEPPGGTFEMNERAKQLLKRVNAYRTDIDKRLRKGQMCFFGKRYARVDVDPRLGRGLIDALPEAMRDAADGNDLFGRMRSKGFIFMSALLCADLIENRADYTALIERRQKLKEDDDLQKMLSNGAHGGVR